MAGVVAVCRKQPRRLDCGALGGSAALPLVFAAGIALAAWQLTRGFYSSVKPLYGASAWASEAEMLSAGIKQSRSPF